MFVFENLLRNEYIPDELPPCFTTDTFADNHDKIVKLVKDASVKPSEPLIFSGYKNSNARRNFAIPNPFQYAKAAYVITDNSANIFMTFNNNKHSLTVPLVSLPSIDEPYKKPVKSISESKEKIKKIYQNNLFEIRLDIQSFFDNIYTHTIPWAMHTKSIAKKKKNDKTLVGNQIDSCIQNLNSGQTNGILVGNSLSRIISEIILCSVDTAIESRLADIAYLRYVDDYYIFVKDASYINNVLAIFRQELAKYELLLNENKLKILESPFMYGNSWVEEMRIYARLEPPLLLEKAIIEYRIHKDIAIIKYALRVLRGKCFSRSEWKAIEPVISNIWVRFPSLSKIVTVILKNNEMYLGSTLIKRCIYAILDRHIALRNDEEVIWAVWMSKVFNVNLSLLYINKIIETENWLAIIILLDVLSARKNDSSIKRIINEFRKRIVEEYFSDGDATNAMHTDIWLLAYEADKNKWLNTSATDVFQYARKHQFFKELRDLNIDFYNCNFNYDIIGTTTSNSYVTRKELVNILKEYTQIFEAHKNKDTPSPATVIMEEKLYEKIVNTLKDTDEY